MRRAGADVLAFAAGEPDFDTPECIKLAAIEALRAGLTKYAPIPGDEETRHTIARKLATENGIPDITGDHVVISTGAKHSIYLAMQCLIDQPRADDSPHEVLIPVPAWLSYAPVAQLAGARVVEIPTTASSGFRMTPEQLDRALSPRSRLLVLNSPCNPCGTMYRPDDLRALASVILRAARERCPDLCILSDEIYERIVYGPDPHFSIGSIPAIAERVITINGMSKAFAMTGWRIGYLAGSGSFGLVLAEAVAKLQGQMTSNITSFLYPAIRAALRDGAADSARMCAAFALRASLIHERLGRIPGLRTVRPVGAFYAFPDVSSCFGMVSPRGKLLANADDFAAALLDEHAVAAIPGTDFGGCGSNHMRFSFACSESQIERGMDRLGEFVSSLR